MSQAIDHFTEVNESAKSILMLAGDLTIIDATSAFLNAWSLQRDNITGHSVFEIFPNATEKNAIGQDNSKRLIPLQEVFDHAPGFICVMRGPTHVIEIVNKPCYQIACHRPIVGMPARELLNEESDSKLVTLLDQVYATAQSYVGRAHKLKLQPYPGAERIEAYIDFVFQPILAGDGAVDRKSVV